MSCGCCNGANYKSMPQAYFGQPNLSHGPPCDGLALFPRSALARFVSDPLPVNEFIGSSQPSLKLVEGYRQIPQVQSCGQRR